MRRWYKLWQDRCRSVVREVREKVGGPAEDKSKTDEDMVRAADGYRRVEDMMQTGIRINHAGDVVQDGVWHMREGSETFADPGEITETWDETAAAVHGGKPRGLNFGTKDQRLRVAEDEYIQAVERCNKALADWRIALHKLDWVSEPDQIDYAIYSVIAAEKHYATTLKETKRLYRQLDDLRKQRFA